MALNDKMLIGQNVQIEIDEGNETNQYVSMVDEVIDHNTFLISRPIGREKYAYISLGQVVKMVYFNKEGQFYFNAKVIGRLKAGDLVSFKVQIVSEKHKLQRRKYYRLEIMVPLTISYVNENHEKVKKNFNTYDLSGGGLKIVSFHNIEIEKEVDITLSIKGIEDKVIKGRIVRNLVTFNEMKFYEIGIEFLGLDPRVCQAIIEFIFSKQRELLKKNFR